MTCSLCYAGLGRKEGRKEGEEPEASGEQDYLTLGEVVDASRSTSSTSSPPKRLTSSFQFDRHC